MTLQLNLLQKSMLKILLICIFSLPHYGLCNDNEIDPLLEKHTQECLVEKSIPACLASAPRYNYLKKYKEAFMTGKIFCELTFENCFGVYFSALKYDKKAAADFLAFLERSCSEKKGDTCKTVANIKDDIKKSPEPAPQNN